MPSLKNLPRRIARRLLSFWRDPSCAKKKLSRKAGRHLSKFLSSSSRLVFHPPDVPELSVIIVLYNRAELTLRCLEALGRSTFQNFEVIAVDNASSDRTSELFSRVDGVRYARNDTNLHFLRGSNQGASMTRGEHLLFLNSDTVPAPDALEKAMDTMRSEPEIGALGAKLILPNGRLQEAGSIIWQDGTCLGYGRDDRPHRPQYMFRRDVDYCSGAFIVIPKVLFKRLGGFDLDFVPAYYEETDFCLRLQSAGYRVVYEPQVEVKHFEFASSSASEEALSMQRERQQILCRKHAAKLKEHLPACPENVLKARFSARGNPKLLFIDERLPHYYTGAGYPRANEMLRAALHCGWHVSLYPAVKTERSEDWKSIYSDIPREVEVLAFKPYGAKGLRNFLKERTGYYQAILISRPTTMRTLRPLIEQEPELFSGARLIYDAEAIFSLRDDLYARLKGTPLTEAELDQKIREELSLAQGIPAISAVCSREAKKFRQYGFSDVHVVSHAVGLRENTPRFSGRDSILFVGAIHDDFGPNADSVFWFLSEVLPHLRQSGLKAEVVIAGTNHSRRMQKLRIEGVRIISRVADLASVYDRARLFIAPTRFSAGIPLKVIEATANGLPVVSSPLVAEQLGWRDGTEIEVGNTAAEFAARCKALYLDEAKWQKIRSGSLTRVREDFSKERLRESMLKLLTK